MSDVEDTDLEASTRCLRIGETQMSRAFHSSHAESPCPNSISRYTLLTRSTSRPRTRNRLRHGPPSASRRLTELVDTRHNAVLDHWCLLTARMSTLYMMKEFPVKNEYKDRAIGMTSILDMVNVRSVKSLTNEPTAADGFIRFVNDELFTNPFPFANSDLRIVEGLERESILRTYAGVYATGTNS